MIVTVTCNPAVDVTYQVAAHEPGSVHRVEVVHERPGGKGVNVASVLTQLGDPVLATGFADASFDDVLASVGVRADFVVAMSQLRRTTVIRAPEHITSFWEPGRELDDPEQGVEALAAKVDALLPDASALVVSGSLPPRVPPGLPVRLARLAQHAGVPAVLDLDGAALDSAVAEGGAIVLPNRDELDSLGLAAVDAAEAVRLLADRTGAPAVVTLGPDGVVAAAASAVWRGSPPVRVHGNPTGAGDAVAAAIARGLAAGAEWPAILADAVALSAAAVVVPVAGQVDIEAYRRWRPVVDVRPVQPARR